MGGVASEAGAGVLTVVAALYVAKGGCYYGLPDVEPWGLPDRDAMLYAGPHPVVAHPPCARWCRLAGLVEARWGHKRGDDGWTFAAALASVRQWGGVLEHPAYSDAWLAHGLLDPGAEGWTAAGDGGWVCHVEQGHYGHRARKATWLYACGVASLPSLAWGRSDATAHLSRCGNHGIPYSDPTLRLTDKHASATPPAFRDLLLSIARSVRQDRRTA